MPRFVYLAALVCPLFLAGCGGEKLVPVSGVVTLDGKPVEGATVTFVSEDGKSSFSGSTDSSGNFALQSGEKVGATPGTYKVLVARNPHKPPDEAPDPRDVGKMMKKEAEEDAKEATAAAAKAKAAGGGDAMSKMKAMAPGGGPGGRPPGVPGTVKSDLPQTYANATTTPLTVKVPPDSQPVKIELKSKP